MKSKNMNQVLQAVARSSTLLVVALLSFQTVECKNKKPATKPTARKSTPVRRVSPVAGRNNTASLPQAVVKEEETFVETVSEQPLIPSQNIGQSVDVETTQLEDGGIIITETTIQPVPEEGKVVTTVKEWTMYDYAKAAAIATAVVGAGGLAYIYRDELAQQAQNRYNNFGNWWNNSKTAPEKATTGGNTYDAFKKTEYGDKDEVVKAAKTLGKGFVGAGAQVGNREEDPVTTTLADALASGGQQVGESFKTTSERISKNPGLIYDANEFISDAASEVRQLIVDGANKGKESAAMIGRVVQGSGKVVGDGLTRFIDETGQKAGEYKEKIVSSLNNAREQYAQTTAGRTEDGELIETPVVSAQDGSDNEQ